MRRSRWALVWAVVLPAAVAACTAILGLDEKPLGVDAGVLTPDARAADARLGKEGGKDARPARHDGGADVARTSHDAGSDHATPKPDAGRDAPARDAPADGSCTPDEAGYNSLTVASCWATVEDQFGGGVPYAGATFDGRYAYFLTTDGIVVQYDTTAPSFSTGTAWKSFDLSNVPGLPMLTAAWYGLAFDGEYVYCVPQQGAFVRYDTARESGSAFEVPASWSFATPAGTSTTSYSGATFDGTYVYFVPFQTVNNEGSGLVTRYDTKTAFDAGSAWTTFDTTKLGGGPAGFTGAVFDGTYVYLVPTTSTSKPLVRFPTASFQDASAWSVVDLNLIAPGLPALQTGAYDGRYIYTIPLVGPGPALRYDTHGAFNASADTWTTSPALPDNVNVNYACGAFDGEYVYLIAYDQGQDYVPAPVPSVVRVARDAPFGDPNSWTSYDTTPALNTAGFSSAVFDGRYLYLAPSWTGTGIDFARFEARATPIDAGLPQSHGSFY